MEQGKDFLEFLTRYEWVRFHEAGHAVVADLMGYRLKVVTALTGADLGQRRDGYVHYAPISLTSRSRPTTVRKAMRVALAGGIAERIACPGAAGGDDDDSEYARRIAQSFLHPSGGELERLNAETETLLRRHWPAVEEVAMALFEWEGKLDGKQCFAVIRAAPGMVDV